MEKVVETLEAAKQLIVDGGWITGAYQFGDYRTGKTCYCAVGAIAKASGVFDTPQEVVLDNDGDILEVGLVQNPESAELFDQALRQFADEAMGMDYPDVLVCDNWERIRLVTLWNDGLNDSDELMNDEDSVASVFDAAIEVAKARFS